VKPELSPGAKLLANKIRNQFFKVIIGFAGRGLIWMMMLMMGVEPKMIG
jgi:hypothetical protein